MKALQEIFWKVFKKIVMAYIKIKWSCWNPWALAKMNLAWSKYVKTTMYEGRVEADRHFAVNQPNYDGDFPYEAFIEYNEFNFFYSQRTWLDRIRIVFAPFSFGNRFRMPWWRITWWWYGIDEKNLT